MSNHTANAAMVKKTLSFVKGDLNQIPTEEAQLKKDGILSRAAVKKNVLEGMQTYVREIEALRKGTLKDRPREVTFLDFVKHKLSFESLDSLYQALDIDPSASTVHSLMTSPEFNEGFRWLIPEVIREAVRLGLRRQPIYTNLIVGDEAVSQRKVIMPQINMSDATPSYVNEGESIPTGTVSFGEKDVSLRKIATGLQITDEVEKYVSLNILSLYLQDAGVRLGLGLDALAIDTLINGEDDTGNHAAATIGVETTGQFIYKDLLRAWVRMGRIGRTPSGILSNEDAAIDIMLLDEFKRWSDKMNIAHKTLDVRTPIPDSQAYWIHGSMPNEPKIMLVDTSSALLKLTSSNLSVESERIANKQISGTYMSLTTGFTTLFRDARLIINNAVSFSGNGFPSWMDINAAEQVVIS